MTSRLTRPLGGVIGSCELVGCVAKALLRVGDGAGTGRAFRAFSGEVLSRPVRGVGGFLVIEVAVELEVVEGFGFLALEVFVGDASPVLLTFALGVVTATLATKDSR